MGQHDQLPMEVAMNVMYNSENYYVVEFLPGRQGIELVDKTMGRAGFLQGEVELKFRASMANLAAGEPSGVDLGSSRAQFLNMTQVAKHDPLVECAEQMSARVPAGHTVESRPRCRLHVRAV